MCKVRNTEREKKIMATASYGWTTASASARSGYNKVTELLRPNVPEAEVEALFEALTKIRGAHRVQIRPSDNGYRAVYVRGTDRAVRGAANAVAFSGLREADKNANHDHAKCIAFAASQGVPPSWAHMVETYLSM